VSYLEHIIFIAALYSLYALSQFLLSGTLKLLTIVQAGFAAVGAYTAAVCSAHFGIPFPITLLCAGMVAAIISTVAYSLFSDLDPEEQVLASLAFQILIIEFITNAETLTNGSLGIAGITISPLPTEFRSLSTISLLFIITVIASFLINRFLRTGQGKIAILVGENSDFAQSIGVDTSRVRLKIIGVSAFIAGLAGAIYAHYFTYIDPSSFGISESVFILAIVIIGGATRVAPVLVAAIVFALLPELLRALNADGQIAANVRQILFGICLVIAIYWQVSKESRYTNA